MVKGAIERAGWWPLPRSPLVEGGGGQTVNPLLKPAHPGIATSAPAACSQERRKADNAEEPRLGCLSLGLGRAPSPMLEKFVRQVRDCRGCLPRKKKTWCQEDSQGWATKLGSSTGDTLQVTWQRPWTRVCYCHF